MKEIPIRNYMGANISEIWAPDDNWKDMTDVDVVTLHSYDNPPKKLMKFLEPQNTFYTDLREDEETLFSNIKKSFRYEINRNTKCDGIKTAVYPPEELGNNDALLDEFRKCYHEMYREKGKNVSLSDLEVYPFIKANALWITVAYDNKDALVFHSYIDCGDVIRLFQSCSCFRDKPEKAALIGRSNKRLHWEDMLFYKRKGFRKYDWGGAFVVRQAERNRQIQTRLFRYG